MLLHSCKACLLAIVQLAAISGTLGVIAPYFIEEPSDIYVRKGKSAVLNCRVAGDPKPSITWKRNGITLNLDSRRMIKADGSLYFSEIIHNKTQKPDEGTYQCEAVSYISVDYIIISRTARVIVAGISSKVAVTPSSLRSTYGDTSRLFCSIKHSIPKALFAWKKQGSNVTITTGNHYTLTPDGALQIKNIRFEDQGKYECIAANTETMRKHTSTNAANLQVVADLGFPRPPHFETSPKDTVAISGSKVVLECIANGDPKPRVTWLQDGSPIQLGSRGYSIFGESNLMIQSVSVEHAGVYTCRATALTRFKEATAKLDVHYGPVFTKKPSVLHAHVNTIARFECTADGIPKPNITWAKNGEELSGTSDFIDIEDGYLVVYDLVLSDKGAYQCFAKNSLGTIQATTELAVYRKGVRLPTTTPTPTQEPTTTVITTSRPTIPTRRVPEKPENVVARALSDTEIELSWSSPTVTNGEIVKYSCIFYEVAREGSLGGTVKKVNTSGDNNRILISNLKPDTNYHFNVFAHNKNGAGGISDVAVAGTYPSSQVPGRPLNLVAEAESDSTIRVTWAAPVTGPSSVYRYIIIYKDASSNSGDMRDVTKQQTRVLRDLKTYTKYTIAVYAENQKGVKGASVETEATTKGGVPRVTPTDFALKPESSGTGLISTWTAPDPTKVNGRITFYIIKYRKAGSTDESTTERIGADRLAYVIKGLMQKTRYQAKIAAGTESGLGEYTRDWVEASTNVTNCKEDTYPGKPKFVNIDKFSNAILVRWLPPDNAGAVCVTEYHLGWGKNTPYQFNSKPLSSDETQYLIKDLSPDQNYVIKLWATNSKSVGLDVQIQVKTLAKQGAPEPVKSVKAVSRSSHVMHISWRDTKVSLSAPVVYHVYSQRNQLIKYCGNTTEKSIKCTRLKPYTKYVFYVRRNEEGINATVSNFTMEDKPGSPMDLTGNPNEQDLSRLTLQWQPPLEHNGHILAYRIYYSINGSASHEKWDSVEADGSSLTKEISGLKPGTAYYFKIQARTKKGWGPLTSKKKVSTLSTPVTGIPEAKDPSATGLSSPAPSGPNAAAQAGGAGLKNKTLWIIIAAVAGITLIAIIIISVILCKKRSGDDIQRKPPTYKQVIQANGSAKKKHKEEKPPDLWINHTDNLEMKPVESANPAPDVTNTTALIPRSSDEMKPLEDSPLDHMHIDHERSSFLNGSEVDPDDFADLPPPPMIDSKDDPYLDYPDDNRTPTPPPSPEVSPFNPPRPVTPENVKQPMYPMTSTPRHPMGLPRTSSYENTLDVADPRPPQRSRSYDPDFTSPTAKVPVYPMLHQSPAPRPISPKYKPPVAPADDIQLPPVGFNRNKPSNGYWAPPPRYEDIFARRSNPPSSPQREPQDAVVADLDKEIAGLEGLMRDLNEITAGDYII